jgi:type IX secretion system PorP/SprF family membrane protein
MKKLILMIIGFGCSLYAFSQAKPFYTQYILNNYILNPAVTGIENYTDVKLSYRNQWVGITGAPVTTYASVQGPIGKSDYKTNANSFEVPGENPRGKSFLEDYTVSEPHHGAGFIALNDKTGYINRWSIFGTYAYHKPLSTKMTLSAGIEAGFSSVNLDRTKIEWANLDPNDPTIGYANSEIKKIKPELGVGLWLYGARYYIGASVLNLIPGKAKFVNNDKYGTYFTPNYFVTAGYRFMVTEDISALPSVMYQFWQPQLSGLHGNLKMQYRDNFWVGGSYRYSDLVAGYSAMAGLNIGNGFNVSYAYENATTSRLRTLTKNTHEIILGFILGNKFSDSCPRNVW